jgi:hypothetical protein
MVDGMATKYKRVEQVSRWEFEIITQQQHSRKQKIKTKQSI